MNKVKLLKIIIFVLLLLLANNYLLGSGLWTFRDAAYWPKNDREAISLILQQLRVFSNYGYYLGYDQGLFNYTRIGIESLIALSFSLFGVSSSQAVFSLFGYTLSFISFYLFLGIFFKDSNLKYLLSLIYVFNPLSYALQGYVIYNAAIPLFIYSFDRFFYSDRPRMIFLSVNIFALLIWVAYIRFLESNLLIVVPYIVYLILTHGKPVPIKRLWLFITSYLGILSPVIYSTFSQFLERSETAFFYKEVYGRVVAKVNVINVFNLFPVFTINLYDNVIWIILGLALFTYVVFLIYSFNRAQYSSFYILNLSLVMIGFSLYGLANAFGDQVYYLLLNFFPFLTNSPYFALYIIYLPFIVMLGILTKEKLKHLYLFAAIFITLSTFPLLDRNDLQLHKLSFQDIPVSYRQYFIDSYSHAPEATYYFNRCWRAEYMDRLNIPTYCPNWGFRYSSVMLDDPRLVSGEAYLLAQKPVNNDFLNNLRVTHNLKNVIIPNDIVRGDGEGLNTWDNKISEILNLRAALDDNSDMEGLHNDNFSNYFFINRNQYNFFIYAPKTLLVRNIDDLGRFTENINSIPVFLGQENTPKTSSFQQPQVFYKTDPDNPTKYYLRLSGVDRSRPFFIQFNQTYGHSWELRWIDEQEFDRQSCLTKINSYAITNNSSCEYKSNLFEPSDIYLLSRPKVDDINHVQSNFLNNGWFVDRRDIPSAESVQNSIYAVLIDKKQVFYSYLTLSSILLILLITTVSVYQELRINIKHE